MSDISFITANTISNKQFIGYTELGIVPECFTGDNTHIILGKTMEWCKIEIYLFGIWIFTMLLYMLKSRCFFVGINPKMRFDPFFMSLMSNRILDQIDVDISEITNS